MSSCKDCTERELGCHSWCEKYKNYVKLNEEIKRLRHKEIEKSCYISETIKNSSITKKRETARKARIKEKMQYIGRV